MCCIFTCCGWMIDLIQRAWVFFMSCCISSAVCCVLLTSSMSGVALGYNYSLAEFVDLKETNVSVYLKRGIFDDEISAEAEWRRSDGGTARQGRAGEEEQLLGSPEASAFLPDRSARRLDDSILQSDNQNQFEGSLMKLTAKAPYETTITTTVVGDLRMQEIVTKYTAGHPDQLKAIQSLINMRKAIAARDPNVKFGSTYGYDESMLLHVPGGATRDANYRRQFGMGPDQMPNPQNRNMEKLEAARKAVPDPNVGLRENWLFPKLPPVTYKYGFDYVDKPRYPKPIPLDLGPIRPTRPPQIGPTLTPKVVDVVIKPVEPEEPVRQKGKPVDTGMDQFKEDLVADKFEALRPNPVEHVKTEQGGWKKSEVEYYDEDIKGLPVRKKRSIKSIKEKLETEPHNANSKGENVGITENSNKANEVTHYPNAFLNKLLSSYKPLSNELSFNESEESTKIKSSKINDNLNESMKKVVKMIRSMFS